MIFRTTIAGLAAILAFSVAAPSQIAAQEAVSLGPAQEPLYRAAVAARESGEHGKALEILKGLLVLGELKIAHVEAAKNHLELGRCDDAEASLAGARESPRSNLHTEEEMGQLLTQLQNELRLNCAGKANAQQLYELGIDYFNNREWLKAAKAFELALASDENATLAHNAGRSYEYAGDLEKAQQHYKLALELAPDDELRDRFERNLERVENLRGQMVNKETRVSLLEISSEPSGAIVRLDGVAVGQTPYQQAAAPGSYNVSVEYEGHTTRVQRVELEPGREVVLNMALEPEGRVWTWIGLSTSAALALGGVTLGLLSKEDLEQAKSVEGKRGSDFDDVRERGKLFANLSLGLFTASAVAAVLSGVFFVYETPEDVTPEGQSLRLFIGPDFVGIGGAF